MTTSAKNKGWTVTMAGLGINLALGILYTWSIFKGAIQTSIEQRGEGAFQWKLASLNDPYAACVIVFAISMIFAGKLQDSKGPKITALIGGLLVGLGFIVISQTTSYSLWILGFGFMVGIGIGFGYSASAPPALKWFPASKSGLIAGIVVSGFGLASLYIAPLATYLLGAWGLQKSMLFFGIAFVVVVCGCAMMLVNPPAGYVPQESGAKTRAQAKISSSTEDFTASEMLRTPAFYLLWVLYFIGAGAGLMVIGSVAGMAKKSMGDMAFVVVAMMAIGNAGGRIIAGILSDKIGRNITLILMLVFQAVLMFIAIPLVGGTTGAILLVLLASFIGFNYGTNLSLFPTFTKAFWGMKNFGVNYGFVFTAWGAGGFVMSRLSQMIVARTGSFNTSFIISGGLLILGAILTSQLKKFQPHHA